MAPSFSLALSREWSDLGDGPAGLVADCVLAYDVADYLRFRAVCRAWRRCSTGPRAHGGLDRRLHPCRWTMLREKLAAPDRRRFLNTSTGECVQVDIPELRDHVLLALTPEGLLVLLPEPPLTTVRLLNPLTRHLTDLPPLTTLLPSKHHSKLLGFTASGSGIASDDSTLVLCFNSLGMLGMAKPGDDHWTLLNYNGHGIGMRSTPLMFAGRFYCVSLNDDVKVLETSPDQPPRLEVAAKLNMPVSPTRDSVHLVNNFGELMLVRRQVRFTLGKMVCQYNMSRVDLGTGTLIPVKTLGGSGRAVFMGMYCSLSVSLDVFPSGSLSADTIYLSFDVEERKWQKVGAYHLANGTIDPPYSLVPPPHTLVDCLSLSNTGRGIITFP